MTIDLKQIATAQEVFDYVANHLITQGRPAMNGETCVYRAKDGTSCAVGCLIPDDEYNRRWEGSNIHSLMVSPQYKKGRSFLDRMKPFEELLSRLQSSHDFDLQYGVENCKTDLKEIAADYNLKVNFQ